MFRTRMFVATMPGFSAPTSMPKSLSVTVLFSIDDVVPAVHVDARAETAAVVGAGAGHAIPADGAVAGGILRGVGAHGLAADEVEADVVHVVDIVADDLEAGDIAVEDEGFALGWLAVVDLVAINEQVGDGSDAVAIDGDAHRVRPANLVDAALADFEMIAGTLDADA